MSTAASIPIKQPVRPRVGLVAAVAVAIALVAIGLAGRRPSRPG